MLYLSYRSMHFIETSLKDHNTYAIKIIFVIVIVIAFAVACAV